VYMLGAQQQSKWSTFHQQRRSI